MFKASNSIIENPEIDAGSNPPIASGQNCFHRQNYKNGYAPRSNILVSSKSACEMIMQAVGMKIPLRIFSDSKIVMM